MKVRLRKGSERHGLGGTREYLVVGRSDEYLRLVNDRGEPCLYEAALFESLDTPFPDDWVTREYEDGEIHVDPPELAIPGFYERWHDGEPSARKSFARVLERLESEA